MEDKFPGLAIREDTDSKNQQKKIRTGKKVVAVRLLWGDLRDD